jgi:hypothetical protein
MRQTTTDHRRTHRVPSGVAGSQFTLDAYSHGSASYRGFRYGDIFTDINTGASYAIMTKDRGTEELCLRSGALFDSHHEWRGMGSDIDRFIRVESELSYQSIQFMQHASKYGYRVEATPPRDKDANGIEERAVGIMLAPAHASTCTTSPELLVPMHGVCLQDCFIQLPSKDCHIAIFLRVRTVCQHQTLTSFRGSMLGINCTRRQ